jgi:phage I-like protein
MTSEEPNKELNKVKEAAEEEGVPHLVSQIQTVANQVGKHVLSAMEHEQTVAVLTTITGSTHGQQVISIPLTAEHVQQVHGLIEEIHQSNEPERVPCVGFHCYLEEEESEEE